MLAQFAIVIAVTAFISAINALTLKPTQCALWLRQPVPPDERNFFYRGFNAAYNRLEYAYAWLIGALVKRAGLVVLIGLIVSALGIWGIARLPTAFIPNEDQGYAMIAVQLPDGAALGRTVNSLNEATKIALATPGVKQVITIAARSRVPPHGVAEEDRVHFRRKGFRAGAAADPGDRQCRRFPDAGPVARRELQLHKVK